MLHEAKEEIKIIPAQYEIVEETVLLKEAGKKLVVEPAQYKWVEETKMIAPVKKNLVPVPAAYETVTEKVLVREAHTEWKKGKGPIQKIDETTGEIICLVTKLAVYKTVTKKVLKPPATIREEIQPAVYETIKNG